MTKLKLVFLLTAITLVAFCLRINKTGSYPSLLWDEAALGYNAFSIINTGKDEYGKTLPLIFKSFGDYKPGVYVYLALPFIKLFGLTDLSVRLPSIIFGSLLPLFFYLLITEISPKSKFLALIAALVITFNPFNIHFSRGAWETNVLTSLLVIAAYFYYKWPNQKKSIYLFFCSLIFGITLYTYQSAKMIDIFIICILLLSTKDFVLKNLRTISYAFILPLFIFSIPIIYGLLFQPDANRLKVISLFSYPQPTADINQIKNESGNLDYDLFHNQTIYFLRGFFLRYFNHFSPRYLLFEGDWQSPRHSAPYIGMILYPSLIFLIAGLCFIPNTKYRIPNTFFLLWLLLAPIPAALTRDSVQSVRAMSFSIPLVYFISLGIHQFINWKLEIENWKFFASFLLVIGYFLSFIYYSDLYYNHMVKKSPNDFLYGHKQAMQFFTANQSKYKNAYFSDFYGQPYIYYLFYSQYPPQKYQSQAKITSNSIDTGKVESIDNIKFSAPSFTSIVNQPSTLVVYSNDEILRQNINNSPDFPKFIPLSPINGISTFYAYSNQ